MIYRVICLFLIVVVNFILQTTVFQGLSFAGIVPNLMIILVSSFGFMRGKKEGMFLGFFCGLLIDIFFGFYLGAYALLFMYVGFINGMFQKHFYPDDLKLPLLMIGLSDLSQNLVIYFIGFLFRSRYSFLYYLRAIILPEFVYTMIIAIFLYPLFLWINQKMDKIQTRRVTKFHV